MVKTCVIGAGNHSQLHHGASLKYWAERTPEELELSAICDLDRKKAEEFAGVFGFHNVYTDFHRMIRNEKPDALWAITPVTRTFGIVSELLPYGIPLLIEKPPGRTPEETAELLDLSRRHTTPAMISFNRRFNPAVIKARRWLADLLGTNSDTPSPIPELIVARMLRVRRREPEFIRGTAIHLVDTVLSLAGKPDSITSARWTTSDGGQACAGVLRFQDGSRALLAIHPDTGVEEETYELIGPGYSICVDTLTCRVVIMQEEREVLAWQAEKDSPPFMINGALEETDAFLRAVRKGEGFSPDLEEALTTMRVTEALHQGGATDSSDW